MRRNLITGSPLDGAFLLLFCRFSEFFNTEPFPRRDRSLHWIILGFLHFPASLTLRPARWQERAWTRPLPPCSIWWWRGWSRGRTARSPTAATAAVVRWRRLLSGGGAPADGRRRPSKTGKRPNFYRFFQHKMIKLQIFTWNFLPRGVFPAIITSKFTSLILFCDFFKG